METSPLLPPRVANVDLGAFIAAAVMTPIAFGISGVVIFFYGVFFTGGAAVLGMPAYLFAGLPAAWFSVTRWRSSSGRADLGAILGIGLLAHFLAIPFVAALVVFDDPREA